MEATIAQNRTYHNLSSLDVPSFLMNVPFSYSAKEPDNIWMQELRDAERVIDRGKAIKQFLQLYQFLASQAFVQNLPTPKDCQLQDLVFVSNLGVVLEHLPAKNTVLIAHFKSPIRAGETEVGVNFFKGLGYDVHVPPYIFEGEAELKHVHENVYIGGYGVRSDIRAYEWMEARFDMQIVKVRNANEYLYHLDGLVFPLTKEQALVCTALCAEEDLRAIERVTNIIDISGADAYAGITNSVRVYRFILNSSHLLELKAGTEEYKQELKKNRHLEEIAAELALDVSYFNLSEYFKGGAKLSCLVMHLNRKSYEIDLL